MEDKGAKIFEAKRAPFSSVIFIINGMFLTMMTIGYLGRSQHETFPIFDQLFLIIGMAFMVILLNFYYTLDRKTPIVSVYENGIKAKPFKWTGSPFIPWKNISSLCTHRVHVKGVDMTFVCFVPKDPDFYWRKRSRFMKLLSFYEYRKYNTPLVLMVKV